jgi:uncharacterized membrane protein YeaQ/YmgE (transglycosylase-associated protein family)
VLTILKEMSPLFELAAMGSLCCWTVSIVVGLGLCGPDRAVLMGLPGTVIGNAWFEIMGWSPGPPVLDYPILPSLVGTTLVLILSALARQLYDEVTGEKQGSLTPDERRWQFRVPPSPRSGPRE